MAGCRDAKTYFISLYIPLFANFIPTRQRLHSILQAIYFSKMKQELKKLKTEMEQMQDEILRETANISQWQMEIKDEKKEIEKEMEMQQIVPH